MKQQSKAEHGLFLVVVALMAWAIPGAGHFLIKQSLRAVIIFVTITATFLIGLYIGSIGVVNPQTAKPWYMAQIFASPAVGMLASETRDGDYEVFGRPADIGQIYTSIAGLLNLLCIISAVYMAYQGRGEMIGHEEDEEPQNA